MKARNIIKVLLSAALVFAATVDCSAQFLNNLKGKLKEAVVEKVSQNSNVAAAVAQKGGDVKFNNVLYVSAERGSARSQGTKDAPLRDVQKAINMANDGDVIRIAEGNYLGNLDRGWLEIKEKYVSLEGGWNNDFTERNPLKYVTRIQPGKEQAGTIARAALLIECLKNPDQTIVIDGIFFDLGMMLEYCKADPSDPRYGCPEGCETGRVMPVGNPPNKTVRLLGGKVAGRLIVRNCMFLNASFNGIIMTNMGGFWEIYNNVFVSNLYASCEITGGLNQQNNAHKSHVDFHHNTVMFSWPTTKEMESMGYGYRFRNGCDHTVHNNIFGCNNFGALDGGWDDSNLPQDKRKVCSAYDNLFFMNKGDLVVAGTSGGKWLYVPGKRFDEVEMLKQYENNRELPESSKFKEVIDPAYLKGYASLEIISTSSYDPNSAANLYREAHGLNKQGTMTTRVSMFGNRYNFDKAMKFFGAEPGYGAQLPQ